MTCTNYKKKYFVMGNKYYFILLQLVVLVYIYGMVGQKLF